METAKRIGLVMALLSSLAFLAAGCAGVQGPSKAGYQGAAAGAAVGAVAGALLDDDNSWKGGVIGGSLGALLGGALTELSARSGQQSQYSQAPVNYARYDSPRTAARTSPCQMVVEKHYQQGRLVRQIEREVCN